MERLTLSQAYEQKQELERERMLREIANKLAETQRMRTRLVLCALTIVLFVGIFAAYEAVNATKAATTTAQALQEKSEALDRAKDARHLCARVVC